jgi:UDP:flavonoid glycosyltransferase YjiC (YdhE family)
MDEQLFWAKQLQSLGLAGKPLAAKYVSANTLAQAIQNVLNDGSYYNTAQKVSPSMQKQYGIGKAVALLAEQFYL